MNISYLNIWFSSMHRAWLVFVWDTTTLLLAGTGASSYSKRTCGLKCLTFHSVKIEPSLARLTSWWRDFLAHFWNEARSLDNSSWKSEIMKLSRRLNYYAIFYKIDPMIVKFHLTLPMLRLLSSKAQEF